MFPGMGNINPKQMQAMMKQMGIKQEDVEAERVIIEKADGRIIIENPSIQKITMQGQVSFQISGDLQEDASVIRDEDISLVVEKTGKSEEEAKKALEDAGGDIAEAIMSLSE